MVFEAYNEFENLLGEASHAISLWRVREKAASHANPQDWVVFDEGGLSEASNQKIPIPQASSPPNLRRGFIMKGNLFMLACAVSLVAVARENPVAIVVSGGRSQSRARQSAVSVHGLCHLNGHYEGDTRWKPSLHCARLGV